MSVEIYVRDSSRATLGMLSSWTTLTLIQRRNDVGKWVITLSSSDDANLLAPGTGVIIKRDDVTLASGWRWTDYEITAEGSRVAWTTGGHDDTVVMHDTLCWPAPTQPIGSQSDREFVTAINVPASTRIRQFFQANVMNRLQVPGAALGAGTGLGPQGRSRARFRNLLDLAQEIAGRDVCFRVIQQPNRSLALECWTPADLRLDVQFSPDVGTVHGWTFSDVGPEATRAIIGMGGEGTARVFRQRVSSSANNLVGSRESDWGNVRRIERFIDARDLNPEESGTTAEADARGDEALTEARRRQSFSLDVSDLPDQRWGDDYRTGDLVRAYAIPGQPVDDLVEQIELTITPDGGERTKVWVGPVDDPDEYDAERDRRLRKQLRQLQTAL